MFVVVSKRDKAIIVVQAGLMGDSHGPHPRVIEATAKTTRTRYLHRSTSVLTLFKYDPSGLKAFPSFQR